MREASAVESLVESQIDHVTVFARGARVRRVAIVRTPLPSLVRFAGLPVAVIDDTVRAEVVGGGATVTMLRVGLDTPGGETRGEEGPALVATRRRVALASAEVDRLRQGIDRLAQVPIVEHDPSDEAPAPWHEVLAARRTLVTLRAERELALRQQLATARAEHDEAIRALEVEVERDQRASSARAARLHEVRKHVDLELATDPGAGDVTLRIEYQVAAARWAPSYVARLEEGSSARFELRAIVAQCSGEDWSGVALQLSTAEPAQFAQLPELHPQKIGRRQAEPARRGFRAPPAGAELLYADYDRQFPRSVPPRKPPVDESLFDDLPPPPGVPGAPGDRPLAALDEEVWDEGTSRARQMFPDAFGSAPPPPPQAMPPMSPAPMPPMQVMAAPKKSGGIAGAVAGAVTAPFALAAQGLSRGAPGGGGAAMKEQNRLGGAAQVAPVAPAPRLDYGNLRMALPSSRERGTLVPAPAPRDGSAQRRVADGVGAIDRLALPPGHVGEWAHTYDYAFASDGKVDVASDGAWHSLALTSRDGTARVRHVTVPREQPDAFRVATITNPFEGPLLPGPIDVYDRGQFLVTSDVDYTPPGGSVDVGLGVDPQVKVARNADFHEETAGMLRGALKLFHSVSVEVENLSARAIDLEVRERVPVPREGDDDIEVTIGKVEPPWERWRPDALAPHQPALRGGHRWRLEVAPRAKKQLRASYEVKISGKLELIGGNRREP